VYQVNDKQIDYILSDIRRRGVEMEDLQYNLLDHICCIIEQNLERNGDFEDFYKKTIPRFFKHELWEIEEETLLLLTHKNYYTMKKAMIFGGLFSLAFIALGTVFKIYHWPGAALSLIVGFVTLCFVFFPSVVYLNYTSEAEKRKLGLNLSLLTGGIAFMAGILFKTLHWPGSSVLLLLGWSLLLGVFLPLLLFSKLKESSSPFQKRVYILGAVAMIVFEMATMFKVFHWPGAGFLLLLGSLLLIILFIPMYTWMKLKNKEMTNGQFVFVITLTMYAVVFTFLLTMNVSGPVLEAFERSENNSAKLISYFEKKNQRLLGLPEQNDTLNATALQKAETVSEAAARLRKLIFEMKCDLVRNADGGSLLITEACVKMPGLVTNRDNYEIVNELLLAPHQNKASLLKSGIENFRTLAIQATERADLEQRITQLLETKAEEEGGEMKSWEEKNFRNSMLISALSRMSEIEKNICMVESEIILNSK